jgi:hypothetical protein
MLRRVPRVRVVYNGLTAPVKNGDRWDIPLAELARANLKPAILLAEDLTDAKVFLHSARHFAVHAELAGSELNAELRGGGGRNTSRELEQVIHARSSWCLCITDGDQIAPNAPLGQLSSECRERCEHTNWVAFHYSLPVREIENLVPPELMAHALDAHQAAAWDAIKGCLQARSDLRAYCDYKEGVTLRSVYKLDGGTPAGQYWLKVVTELHETRVFRSDCFSNNNCADPQACRCVVIPGLGDRLLDKLLRFLEERSWHSSYKLICRSEALPMWLAVGEIVFEWFCSPRKMRA